MTSLRPSTADNTEIAGVIMESPMNIEAPTTPSASNGRLRRPNARCPSAIRDSVPPSPLLSARNSSSTYLAVTTMNSDHRISESTPSTMARDTGAPFAAWRDGLAKRIQRRGADIAENNANASQRQGPKARGGLPLMGFGRCDADSHDGEERSRR